MNVLIVFCHPSKRSYTGEVLEQLKAELISKKCPVEISDLYAINFQGDMTEKEFERESSGNLALSISPDVLQEHEKIQRADCIIFLYPVWWGDCPAKLKGWFDRVYAVGFAYKQKDHFPKMKSMKYGVALCTAGYSNEFLRETGIAQSMENIMVKDRLGARFGNKELIILGGTLDLDKVRQQHEVQIKTLADKIEKNIASDNVIPKIP
jgi:NAD(P)H dehydrogenase (quinone)